MHPPLLRPHPQCGHVVKLLVQCHEENKFAKYFGACNDQKVALDQCFRAEKELKRRQNLADGSGATASEAAGAASEPTGSGAADAEPPSPRRRGRPKGS